MKYQERKYIIEKMKYAPYGPIQFLCRILHYRFLSWFLVGDHYCRLLHFQRDTLGIQTYYEVNCCCIIPHTLNMYHIVWQYHGRYSNSEGSLLCYLHSNPYAVLSESSCYLLEAHCQLGSPMEIKARVCSIVFVGDSFSEIRTFRVTFL